MGKTMPKWALHGSHKKHPLYSLYASRKLLHERLATTKNHLANLYTNEEYLHSIVQKQIDWYTAQPGRHDDYRDLLIRVNEIVTSLPLETFVAFRYLQKDINNIRKMVQEKGAENLEDQVVGSFEENLYMFGKLLNTDLWRAYYTEESKWTNQIFDFWKLVSSHSDVPYGIKHEMLQNDGVFARLWGLECCQCYHRMDETFLDLAFYLDQDPSEEARFEPQILSSCLTRIDLFHHLAKTADVLTKQICCTEHRYLGTGGLELFVEDFVDNGPMLFNLEVPIVHTIEALETYVRRRKNCQKHIDCSLMWRLILRYLETAQRVFHIDSSEFKEAIDIIRPPNPTRPTTPPVAKGKTKKETEVTTKEEGKRQEIEKTPTPELEDVAKRDEIARDGGLNKNEGGQLRQECLVQAEERINKTVWEDQLTGKKKIMSKYHRRGYGKCKDTDKTEKSSQNANIHERVWRIPNSEHFHSVWRVIFPQTRQDRQISRVSWTLFVEAMTSKPVNCRVKKSDGSMFVFERKNDEGGKEIFQCHAPHDMTWIPASDLYRYKKDLRDTFGMDGDRISLVEELKSTGQTQACD